jgi:hypothetical protein
MFSDYSIQIQANLQALLEAPSKNVIWPIFFGLVPHSQPESP